MSLDSKCWALCDKAALRCFKGRQKWIQPLWGATSNKRQRGGSLALDPASRILDIKNVAHCAVLHNANNGGQSKHPSTGRLIKPSLSIQQSHVWQLKETRVISNMDKHPKHNV